MNYRRHAGQSPVNRLEGISGLRVICASRAADSMAAQGYCWLPSLTAYTVDEDGRTVPAGGTVFAPYGDAFSVFLPGVLPLYPEGKCDCCYFAQSAICGHIYFAVAQASSSDLAAAADRAAPVP